MGSEKQILFQRASWLGVAQWPHRHLPLRVCQSVTVCWSVAPVVRQEFILSCVFVWMFLWLPETSFNSETSLCVCFSVSDPGLWFCSEPVTPSVQPLVLPSGKVCEAGDSAARTKEQPDTREHTHLHCVRIRLWNHLTAELQHKQQFKVSFGSYPKTLQCKTQSVVYSYQNKHSDSRGLMLRLTCRTSFTSLSIYFAICQQTHIFPEAHAAQQCPEVRSTGGCIVTDFKCEEEELSSPVTSVGWKAPKAARHPAGHSSAVIRSVWQEWQVLDLLSGFFLSHFSSLSLSFLSLLMLALCHCFKTGWPLSPPSLLGVVRELKVPVCCTKFAFVLCLFTLFFLFFCFFCMFCHINAKGEGPGSLVRGERGRREVVLLFSG